MRRKLPSNDSIEHQNEPMYYGTEEHLETASRKMMEIGKIKLNKKTKNKLDNNFHFIGKYLSHREENSQSHRKKIFEIMKILKE